MKVLILLIFLLSVSSFPRVQAITLTDNQNRSLEANILLRIGNSIKIELQNGQQYTILISTLNKESQEAVLAWQADKVTKISEPFRVSAASFVEDKEKGRSLVEKTQNYNAGYNVTITNRTPMVMEDLRVEYIVVIEAPKIAARSEKDVETHTLKGEVMVEAIKQGRDVEFQTKTIRMKSSKLASGWSYLKGGSDDAVDELKGIWMKFYIGKKMVFEYSRPSSLAGSFKWDDPPNPEKE